ncbi:endoplasmic reticulum resident protein 44-like, partial [Penaeus indicus]|uniref:endoplasmic reticulum resident protein 44-like n=1 Tax=Penaeus indicus TaxID=29960 RepID=UPI00300C9FC1
MFRGKPTCCAENSCYRGAPTTRLLSSKMLKLRTSQLVLSLHVLVLQIFRIEGGALQLDNSNFDQIIGNNELVFINFYADWCRFSNILAPTWDETADKVKEAFPDEGRVVIGKVDCDAQSSIASRFHITKYPTLKLLRNGQASKREYRGQRSAEAFASFIKEQLKDPIKEIESLNELNDIEETKRTVIGYFENKDVPEYEVFRKVATNLKEDCQFLAGFGYVALVIFYKSVTDVG